MEITPDIALCDHQALVESTKDTVDNEHRRAFAMCRIFDGAAGRIDDLASAAIYAFPRGADFAPVTGVNQGEDDKCNDDQKAGNQPADF